MSRRGWALVLGASAATGAVALGSRPLAVVALGFFFAAGLSRAWARLAQGPIGVCASFEPGPATEGDRIRLAVNVRGLPRVPVGAVTFSGSLEGRPIERRLHRRGASAGAVIDLGALPRGRYVLTDAHVVLSDPLVLDSVSLPVETTAGLLVRPRIVELGPLFTERGERGDGGRRLLSRPLGVDLHSVREHEQGESLRRVHWPTTAKRGRLMVKDLEDAPRDTVAVLLDCDSGNAVGFELAVRAAASLVHALSSRGRRVLLVTTAREPRLAYLEVRRRGLERALDLLAAVRADADHGLAEALHDVRRRTLEAGELVVCTCALSEASALALLHAAERQSTSVVWVVPRVIVESPLTSPDALRLVAAGVPLAVVRPGDDLASALAARHLPEAIRA
jgi:uncharacterized protein (DUF58 family)